MWRLWTILALTLGLAAPAGAGGDGLLDDGTDVCVTWTSSGPTVATGSCGGDINPRYSLEKDPWRLIVCINDFNCVTIPLGDAPMQWAAAPDAPCAALLRVSSGCGTGMRDAPMPSTTMDAWELPVRALP